MQNTHVPIQLSPRNRERGGGGEGVEEEEEEEEEERRRRRRRRRERRSRRRRGGGREEEEKEEEMVYILYDPRVGSGREAYLNCVHINRSPADLMRAIES